MLYFFKVQVKQCMMHAVKEAPSQRINLGTAGLKKWQV